MVIAARSAKRRSVSDSDVIYRISAAFAPHLYWLSSSYLHASQQLASYLDWRKPIGLQERLEGRSSHNGEILCDVAFPLSGNRGYDSNRSVFPLRFSHTDDNIIKTTSIHTDPRALVKNA